MARSDDLEAAALVDDALETEKAKLAKTLKQLKTGERELGVNGNSDLRRLAADQYFNLRMNARALKHRIREKLRARKFELDVVERSYRRKLNGKMF